LRFRDGRVGEGTEPRLPTVPGMVQAAQSRSSRSAANVALVRTHLTWLGVVDDPHAERMLPPGHRRMAAALRLPGLRLLGRHSSFPGLAARTLFFDGFVASALDDGVRQVIIVAAGYDSRAWRLARPGVTFFEVDQPATGWTLDTLLTGADMDREDLTRTKLAGKLSRRNTSGFKVIATK
jgi:methyltransferase (TIGR00027 family)